MATFKMDELKKSVFGSASNAQEMVPEKREEIKPMVGRRGKRSTEASEALIREFILGADGPVTMLQICDHIGRVPAPHFRAMVARLVASGEAQKIEEIGEGGNLPRFKYWRS